MIKVSPLACSRLNDFISFKHKGKNYYADILRRSELFDDELPIVTIESGGVKYLGLKTRTEKGFVLDCKPDLKSDTTGLARKVFDANVAAMHNPQMLEMGRYNLTVEGKEVVWAEYVTEKTS